MAEIPPPKLLGECTVADLHEAPYAEWLEAGYADYSPNPDVLEALRQANWDEVEIVVAFGTWCPDSRREVPRMLKLLDTLEFPRSRLHLIGVDNSEEHYKRSPFGEDEGLEVYRVPTFVVSRSGRELSRVVEYPALSLERDLRAILEGAPYRPSYTTYPSVRQWSREGLLADPNVSASGLANQVRHLVSSEGELYTAAKVFATRGHLTEAAKLMEVDCSLYWDSATCHARLADFQERAGQRQKARASVIRALERNTDPEAIEALVELVDRTSPTVDDTAGDTSDGS